MLFIIFHCLLCRKTVTRDLGGVLVTGSDCSTADGMRRTLFPVVYYLFLFSLFGLTITFFAVLYSQIGLAVLKRKRVIVGSIASSSSASQNQKQMTEKEAGGENGEPVFGTCTKVTVNVSLLQLLLMLRTCKLISN